MEVCFCGKVSQSRYYVLATTSTQYSISTIHLISHPYTGLIQHQAALLFCFVILQHNRTCMVMRGTIIWECLLHVSTFATTRVALPTVKPG
jgi:hypothetical protein